MINKTDSAPLQKNEEVLIHIDDLGSNGEVIGHYNGFAVFVNGALPQETVLAHIIKVTTHYAVAIISKIINASADRIEPVCTSWPKCGGCHFQHLSYEAELEYKRAKIESCLKRIGCMENVSVPNVKFSPNWQHYRNKAQFPIRTDGSNLKYGFFALRSHRIIDLPMDGCLLQNETANSLIHEIASEMKRIKESIYNEETHSGLIKHVLIRTLETISVTFVVSVAFFNNLEHWKQFFEKKQIDFSVNLQPKDDNVIMGPEMIYSSSDKSVGDIGNLRFYIAPQSFFQVNSFMTYELYQTALDFADLKETDDVLDLFCGVGTISLFMAQKAHRVYGIEYVKEAIENARQNAALNNITNTKFFAGPCEEITENVLKTETFNPSVIILDPPRSGCEEALIRFLSGLNAPRIVYVSCDPATLARDLKIFKEQGNYQVIKVQGVDMFPRTIHVETVVLMSRDKE